MSNLGNNASERIVKTACGECFITCGINIKVRDGTVVEVKGMKEHPTSRGFLCPKGDAIPEHIHSPNRLKHPLKKENGNWKRISWDEALDTIAEKLTQDRERHGPGSFAFLLGDALCIGGTTNMNIPFRFCDVYGTPNRFTPGSSLFRNEVHGLEIRHG